MGRHNKGTIVPGYFSFVFWFSAISDKSVATESDSSVLGVPHQERRSLLTNDQNRCPLEGASSGTPLMILLKISQHLQLSKRGSKTWLVINAPAKYAAIILSFVLSTFFL